MTWPRILLSFVTPGHNRYSAISLHRRSQSGTMRRTRNKFILDSGRPVPPLANNDNRGADTLVALFVIKPSCCTLS